MNCKKLCTNTQVVFRHKELRKTLYRNGKVLYVIPQKKQVCVCYRDGLRVLIAYVSFDDMVAVIDMNGNPIAALEGYKNIKKVG